MLVYSTCRYRPQSLLPCRFSAQASWNGNHLGGRKRKKKNTYSRVQNAYTLGKPRSPAGLIFHQGLSRHQQTEPEHNHSSIKERVGGKLPISIAKREQEKKTTTTPTTKKRRMQRSRVAHSPVCHRPSAMRNQAKVSAARSQRTRSPSPTSFISAPFQHTGKSCDSGR